MQQNDDKHKFLNYEKVIVNFIFSFSWDIINNCFDTITKKLEKNEKWKNTKLHKRPIHWNDSEINSSYHPTIVSENLRVLHRFFPFANTIKIIAPYCNNNNGNAEHFQKEVLGNLNADIRIFENGTGTCTFSVSILNDINLNSILLVQHLATSIYNSEQNNLKHYTHSFIDINEELSIISANDSKEIYLAQLFNDLLNSFSEITEFIWDEKEVIFNSKNQSKIKDWQNPYVLTIIQTDKDSLERIFKNQSRECVKEIGAIAVRLTQDNRQDAELYYEELRREYIFRSLGYYESPKDKKKLYEVKLRNYSHHNSLFYTYGRRAAIAITRDFNSHPAYYAIPTFLNILELLRSRWHLGTITNLKLDETFEKIAHTEEINQLIDEIFKCRVMYGLFLQNPTPYLFDSGAVTEISDAAESVFWLSRISMELEKKLAAIDRLVEVKFTKQSLRKFL